MVLLFPNPGNSRTVGPFNERECTGAEAFACSLAFSLLAASVHVPLLAFTVLVAPHPHNYAYGAVFCSASAVFVAEICAAVALRCSRKKMRKCLRFLFSISALYCFIFGTFVLVREGGYLKVERQPRDKILPLNFLMFELDYKKIFAGQFELRRRDPNATCHREPTISPFQYCIGDRCEPFCEMALKLPPLPPGHLDGTQYEVSIGPCLRLLGCVHLFVFSSAFFCLAGAMREAPKQKQQNADEKERESDRTTVPLPQQRQDISNPVLQQLVVREHHSQNSTKFDLLLIRRSGELPTAEALDQPD